MSSLGSPNPFFIAGKKAYEVERSLRFNSADATILQRTLSSSGNRRTFTWSGWVKRSKPDSSSQEALFASTTEVSSGNSNTYITFYQDKIFINSYNYPSGTAYSLTTSQVFRDPSAWYHIVWAVDTTQSTSSNRIKLYVNGEQVTSFSTASYPSQNYEGLINNNSYKMTMGRAFPSLTNNSPLDGYMAEINFIDGFQYDPSYFGETNATTGQWNPKKYTGSYGTNGFYLNFSDNSGTTATTLGKDSSGNGNNFTPNNFSVAAGVGNDSVEDTPTNNFPTFNPLCENNNHTYTEGNLKVTYAANNQSGNVTSMASPKTGKWYWEVRPLNNYLFIGVTAETYQGTGNVISATNTGGSTVAYYQDGQKYVGGSVSSYGASFGSSDLIGVALDMDNGQVTFYKNNTSQGAISLVSTEGHLGVGAVGTGQSLSMSINFGQQAFSYTPPTGFKKLNSANFPDPTIKLPNKHFDTLLYTGTDTAANRTLSGLNFSPDWVWQKRRNGTNWHGLHDSVRGGGKTLFSNDTSAEANNNQYGYLSAFTSDGFTWSAGSTNNSDGNETGGTFVSWCWDAGETDGKTYAVTVVSDSGNKYRFDGYGTSAVTLDLAEGGTYIFDQSDSSNSGHPLRFSTTANGTHGGGSEYTTGVTTAGTPGSSGAYTQIVVAASAPTLYYYCSVHSGMGGQANTNSTLGSSNFDGSIQTITKVNPNAGFSIVSFTGNATSGATVGHGLGVAPKVLIVKERGNTNNWVVYHQSLGSTGGGNTYVLFLDLNYDKGGGFAGGFNNTSPTSSVFSLGNSDETNRSSGNFITYCFSEVAGYSKFGSYTGNGNNDGTFVSTGFRPALVIIKNIDTNKNWGLFDNKRIGFNVENYLLQPSTSDVEDTSDYIDFLSNGFKLRSTALFLNKSGDEFIYLAFAESPFKNARAR